mmetsp:Transcript_147768/g.375480  ORF Transcript_147768/g.375480 Transcript_147768/m.375480 type:complete len:158 (-) Transcript_147768:12-485(-)
MADGIAEAVEFNLHAAIRGTSPEFECPDEDVGCPMTKFVLCAFNSTSTSIDQRVTFMTCWDDSKASAEVKAQRCAAEAKLSWDTISSCVGGGQGVALAEAAAESFVNRFPSHKTGIFAVPHIFINGAEQTSRTFERLLSNLCATGIRAGACSKMLVI